MPTQLSKGANAPLPHGPLRIEVRSGAPLDLSALLVTAADRVRSDAYFVFFNQPGAQGVRLERGGIEIDPQQVPPDIEKVVVVASVDATPGSPSTFGAVGMVVAAVAAGGQDVVQFAPDGLGAETALMLIEVYRRPTGEWKVRGVGQGWSSGLAGIATDFGVSVLGDSAPPPAGPPGTPPPAPTGPPAQQQPAYGQQPAQQPPPPQPGYGQPPPQPQHQQPQQPAFGQPQPGYGTPAAPPAAPAPAPGFFQPPGGQIHGGQIHGGQGHGGPAGPPAGYGQAHQPAYGQQQPGYGQPPQQGFGQAPPAPAAAYTLDHGPVNLGKDQTVNLAKGGQPYLQRVIMGLGWDPAPGYQRNIDLDASCLALGSGGSKRGMCWYNDKSEFRGAIRHSGDDRTGAGGGDDELIYVDLQALPYEVEALVFSVNSYTGHRFTDVRNAWCRLIDDGSRQELVRFDLGTSAPSTGVMMAMVHRSGPGWAMTGLGIFQDGKTVKEMVGPAGHVWRTQAGALNRPSW